MKTYVRIQDGAVFERLQLDNSIAIADAFHSDLVFVQIDGITPPPQIGWLYDGTAFSAPPPAPAPSRAEIIAGALGASDYEMARAGEDVLAALIAKGVLAPADLPPAVVSRVNARRAIRGQGAL